MASLPVVSGAGAIRAFERRGGLGHAKEAATFPW
jgi:hypothetical protein